MSIHCLDEFKLLLVYFSVLDRWLSNFHMHQKSLCTQIAGVSCSDGEEGLENLHFQQIPRSY